MKKYILSFLYIVFLYIFWIGFISNIIGFGNDGINYIGSAGFAFGLCFAYPIANLAERKGYSWWKYFIIYGFLSTGIPIIGLIKHIRFNKMPDNTKNHTTYTNTKEVKIMNNITKKQDLNIKSITELNYKDIFIKNNLESYVELFERNKLVDISIITELNEDDLEKLGIDIMGDRKKILKIFREKELIDYLDNLNKLNMEKKLLETEKQKTREWVCKRCQYVNPIYRISCSSCGEYK